MEQTNPSAATPIPASDPLIGTTLNGYRIISRFGQGGMATVYLAHQASVERDVALKVIRQELISRDPTFHSRFEREAKMTATLEHVHILPVIDFGQANGYSYLVTRLLDQSLADYVQKTQPLALAEIARLLGQIADALDYAHQRQVVHRDLKPENVLMDNQKNCFLADFGIAYLVEGGQTLTAEGMVIGTPAYMAPEQFGGERGTVASDIYALGVMLYEMVCGRLPFTGYTPLMVMNQHATQSPPPPQQWRPDLPVACVEVMLRALVKDPKQRFASAHDLSAAFAEAVRGVTLKPVMNSASAHSDAPTVMEPLGSDPRALGVASPADMDGKTVVEPRAWAKSVVPDVPPPPAALPSTPPKLAQRSRWFAISAVLIVLIAVAVGVYVLIPRPPQGDPAALNEAGLAALTKLDYDTAIRDFQTAIQIEPANAAAHYNLGVAYEETGRIDDAQAEYEAAIRYEDQLLLARYRLAELLLDKGANEQAFQIIDIGVRILELGSVEIDADAHNQITFLLYATRGRAYFQRGQGSDFDLAVNDLQQALVQKDAVPYPAPAYYYLARAYAVLGKQDDATSAWYDMMATYDANNAKQREWYEEAVKATSEAS
ncbi:MAG: protein kinase [Anaerolineae bacterium]|nr:protein kinase [Anaerolineae bacterium]